MAAQTRPAPATTTEQAPVLWRGATVPKSLAADWDGETAAAWRRDVARALGYYVPPTG
ncbi:hypothetical protein [Streptomyces sp. SAI-127]|uniref:hypothetical protein n=1 Tax=Streptomyces sp. SAI-127 TaxID=2940543 RepID=UPI00247585E2|nr:hypothetical protein [Streptomyces sp. SAI-127]MDH6489625.1 hypothetical protein [Streptomyces sp. SAI-127]